MVLPPPDDAALGLAAVDVVVVEVSVLWVQPPRARPSVHARTKGFFIPTNRMRGPVPEPLRARIDVRIAK
ncbi:hypothetical protein WPS_05830 [Vulcanimicrobium alpinum]|uniref:Uncharacterized protein n=1 Tax=Vulcanimicrobium alpinum TaxID=3016050 RepID=A0AAN2C978_UNVUL|nr:hypothetical protein WPS_05830 [Vulcanimicrobium alpinum]